MAAEGAPQAITQDPTTIGSYVMAISKALDASGIDSARILRAAGIELEMGNDPMVRLPPATLSRLFRASVDVTHNPYFGLMVSKFIHISNLHALGYALAASHTLMDFCRRLERYMRLVSQVIKVTVTESDGQVILRFEHLAELCGETEDAFLAFLMIVMRTLYKPKFSPVRVEFLHPMPREGAQPYETLFRTEVLFSRSASLFVFDSADLGVRLGGSCPELAQINDNITIGYLARLDKSDVITGVRQKIIEYLPDGDCDRDKVASALCLSPATLQMKLAQRGTNFQQLFDDTRKELACSYLGQGKASRSVTEITFMLGFADTSNFTRAFKRWTGKSPTDFRLQA